MYSSVGLIRLIYSETNWNNDIFGFIQFLWKCILWTETKSSSQKCSRFWYQFEWCSHIGGIDKFLWWRPLGLADVCHIWMSVVAVSKSSMMLFLDLRLNEVKCYDVPTSKPQTCENAADETKRIYFNRKCIFFQPRSMLVWHLCFIPIPIQICVSTIRALAKRNIFWTSNIYFGGLMRCENSKVRRFQKIESK